MHASFSMLLKQLHPLHGIPLSEVGADHMTIVDNPWYAFLNECAYQIPDKYSDSKLQERWSLVSITYIINILFYELAVAIYNQRDTFYVKTVSLPYYIDNESGLFYFSFDSAFTSKQHFLQEAGYACQLFQALWDHYPHILCHHDLWINNLVYDKNKGMSNHLSKTIIFSYAMRCFDDTENVSVSIAYMWTGISWQKGLAIYF